MTPDPASIARSYFDAWTANNFDALRALLADDATFEGPLGRASNGDECRQGIERLSKIKTAVVIQKMCADADDVLTWFDLHTTVADPCSVVNWTHVEHGKITRIRATFDPRPLISPPGH